MRKLFKLSSLIIFVSAVIGMFASCGNDSELFDEPVMYQTRAMTRASMRSEGTMQDIDLVIKNPGVNVIVENKYLGDKIIARATFNWNSELPSSLTRVTATCEVICTDTNFYCITPQPIHPDGGDGYMNGDIPTAFFTFIVKEKRYDSFTGEMLQSPAIHPYQNERFTAPPAGLKKIN